MRTKKNNPWGDYSLIQNQILLNNITIILVEQLLGIVVRALKFSLKEWGSRSCQSICSVLEQSTFLSFAISPPQSINKYWPSVRRRGEPSLVGLALHSSGVKIVQVTLCCGNWDNLWPDYTVASWHNPHLYFETAWSFKNLVNCDCLLLFTFILILMTALILFFILESTHYSCHHSKVCSELHLRPDEEVRESCKGLQPPHTGQLIQIRN